MPHEERFILPSGTYKIGAHGYVYRWSNFNSEWLRSTMTVEELKEVTDEDYIDDPVTVGSNG